MDEPYRILGLAMGASPDEIKRAYRRLVMKWHPDRNGSPEAEEYFKRIKAAYELINNPDKLDEWRATHSRRKGDGNWGDFRWSPWGSTRQGPGQSTGHGSAKSHEAPRHEPPPDENDEEPEDPDAPDDEPFEPPIHRVVTLTLLEAAFGCEKNVTVIDSKPCFGCSGTGVTHHVRSVACGHCQGIGRVRDKKGGNITCSYCKGKGFVSASPCKRCGGSGSEDHEKKFKVRIPPGMLEGDRVRLAGRKGGREDMFLAITIEVKGILRLHGRDLHCELPVSAFRLLLGGDIEVPSLTGVAHVHLEPGTGLKPGVSVVHRLHGLGFPGRGHRKAGDLVVRIRPVFPTSLTERQREALQKLDDTLHKKQKDQVPDLAAWDAELKAWQDSLPPAGEA